MEFPRSNDAYPEKSKRKFKAPIVTRGLESNTNDDFGSINLGSKRFKVDTVSQTSFNHPLAASIIPSAYSSIHASGLGSSSIRGPSYASEEPDNLSLEKDELPLNSLKAAGMGAKKDGKCKSRWGKWRRSSQKHKENPKGELEQQVPSSSPPPPNSKCRRKCEDTTRSNRPTFLEKLRLRLSGGHFRMLNEKLYTSSGNEAFHLFKNEPELFDVYHAGYQKQMSKWPEQPVNIIVKWLKSRDSSLVVADFGCGNASLSRGVENKVFSIDLVSKDPSVIACDMSHTPLESKSVDVAVFCLSLMGTDYPSYLKEADRVLKPCGWLLVAEVRSRFDPKNGGACPDKFLEAVKQLGFTFSSKDFSNKMFVLFHFKKRGDSALARKAIDWPELKPCLYKRR